MRKEARERVEQVRQAQAQMPFTQEELQQFSKTERRILHMIHILKLDEPQIIMSLEVKPSTMRWHMSSIKQKISRIRSQRFESRTQEDVARHKEKALPPFSTVDEPLSPPPKPRIPRPGKRGKTRPPTAAEVEAALPPVEEERAPLPSSSFSHHRFFPQVPPPIPAASSPLPPSFHPEKPTIVGIDFGLPQQPGVFIPEVNLPIAHERPLENQHRPFGSFLRK